MIIAALLSLLANVAIVALVDRWEIPVTPYNPTAEERQIEFIIEDEEDITEDRYVETNQDVPSNPPDETDNFSNRDQQSANEAPPPELSEENTPFLDGEELDSPKLVDGTLAPPLPEILPSPESEEAVESPPPEIEELLAQEMAPILPTPPPPAPDFLEATAETDEGVASYQEPAESETEERPEEPEETKDVNATMNPLVDPEVVAQLAEMFNQRPERPDAADMEPRPRPRLNSPALPGPVRRTTAGVANLGRIGIDAEFNEFGDYLARMNEVVGTQWLILANQTRRGVAEVASRVIVEFVLNAEGRVEHLEIAFSSASQAGSLICKDAILSREPFGEWTDDMIAAMGQRQPVTFTFIYR